MYFRKRHSILTALWVILHAAMAVPQWSQPVEDPLLSEWREFSCRPECKRLLQWLRCQAGARLTGTTCPQRFNVATPEYFGRLGMFVTLQKARRVRGCFGAFSHSITDAGNLLNDYLTGALTRDPRYRPLDVAELADTRIIITVTSQPFPVSHIDSADVRNFGITLLCGNETAVYVPAEIKSTSSIEKKIHGSGCQVYLFRAVTLQ